jgi:hypothetical protein
MAAATCLLARSPNLRSMAYAALGAVEILRTEPGDVAATRLLEDARDLLMRSSPDPSWPWPEQRLSYANAVIPEALIVIGVALEDEAALTTGLALLSWLLALQTRGAHLSVTPAGGWRTGEPQPGFDQQPIEVTALAEACRRAYEATGEESWLAGLDHCVAWFVGANDLGLPVYDEVSGGCCDGLHRDRVNLNQGAESTLAALATFQVARMAVRESVR